jgi:hypothetical protein
MRTFVELERIIWRTSKAFVFGNPYNTVLATKPETAFSLFSEVVDCVAEIDSVPLSGRSSKDLRRIEAR